MNNRLKIYFIITFLFSCKTSNDSSISSSQTQANPQVIFDAMKKIPFYKKHKKDHDDLTTLIPQQGAAYCDSSAWVWADQIKKKFHFETQVYKMSRTEAYVNYCHYPTSFAWHTFTTIEYQNKTYVIDPEFADQPYELRAYIDQYFKKDCLKLDLQKAEMVASEISSQAFVIESRPYKDYYQFRKDQIQKHGAKTLATGNSNFNNFTFDQELKVLVPNIFLHLQKINEKEIPIQYIKFNIIPTELNFWEHAYSFVKHPHHQEIYWTKELISIPELKLITRENFAEFYP